MLSKVAFRMGAYKTASLFFLLVNSLTFARSQDLVSLQTLQNYSRIKVQPQGQVEIKVTSQKDYSKILLSQTVLTDLGAPSRDLQQESFRLWLKNFQGIRDQRLKKIEIEETIEGVAFLLYWNFPEGKAELAHPEMNTFHYVNQESGEYIFDFWLKSGETLAEANRKKAILDRENAKKTERKIAESRNEFLNKVLSEDRAAYTLTHYCEQPLREEHNLFIAFRPASETLSVKKYLPYTSPDHDFKYFSPQDDSNESQHVRKAIELYQSSHWGLAMKTIELFEKEFKNSKYKVEMQFLKANLYLKLGSNNHTKSILEELIQKNKNSPAALHSAMYLASHSLEDEGALKSLERFMWLSYHHPRHENLWVFHLGAAQALRVLKQTEKGIAELKVVENLVKDKEIKAKVSFQEGDFFLDRKQYERALAKYFESSQKYPEESKNSPSLLINRAESLYWLKQYSDAEKEFLKFLATYPTHPDGWRASYRLGEIYAFVEKQSDEKGKSKKYYLETTNRYPYSPGATLARLRMIPCGDHMKMSKQSILRFFEDEGSNFSQEHELFQDNLKDFVSLSHIRTLVSLGLEDEAFQFAAKKFRHISLQEKREILGNLLEKIVNRRISDLLKSGELLRALNFYQEKMREAPDYLIYPELLLKLSQNAAKMKLTNLSEEILERYKKIKDPQVLSRAISSSEKHPQQSLRDSEKSYTEAKNLWTKYGLEKKSEIEKKLNEIDPASGVSYDRELMRALIAMKEKHQEEAFKYLINAEMVLSEARFGSKGYAWEKFQIRYLLYQTKVEAEEFDFAFSLLSELKKKYPEIKDYSVPFDHPVVELGAPFVQNENELQVAEIDLWKKKKNWKEVATKYKTFLSNEENRSNYHLYQYSLALKKVNTLTSRAEALDVLKEVSESKSDNFWKKLASESLARERAVQEVQNEKTRKGER